MVLSTLDDARCHAAIRAGALRISPHLQITDSHLEQLLNALTNATR